MKIPILIEPVAGNGFRAKGGEPFPFCGEGATRDEALDKLKQKINAHLAAGAEIVPLEVPAEDNPWKRVEGMFKDEPTFDAWQQAIADYRQQIEEDPNIP